VTAPERPSPAEAPAAPSEMGLRLRRVMRQWLTGVAVLTAREGEHVRGMTCNSFNSVSDSPATILVSIRRGTHTHQMVTSTGRYALSILAADGERLANRFAGMEGEAAQDRFDDVPHRRSPGGLPWLDGALGYLECRVVHTHEVGASTLFVAEVEAAEPGDEQAPPLGRFRSAYLSGG
jgi:flavin reductase (DIM6/NTAB) family NADH-FMN oxidoreductase RutF